MNFSKESHGATHAQFAINLAKELADGHRPGILATVDEKGRPHTRYMATLTLTEWPFLYTITSPVSRKVQHITDHPEVSWMFANDEVNVVVNLMGRASVVTDPAKIQRVWKILADKSKAYFLSFAADGPGFAVLETEVEEVECVVPKYDLAFKAARIEPTR